MSRIIKAAIKYNDKICTGFDHGECFKKLPKEANTSSCEPGFVDEDNNFYDRKQAMKIVKENNQLTFIYDETNLISEDLHLNWLNSQEKQIIELKQQLKESKSLLFEQQIKLIMETHKPAFCTLAGRGCNHLGQVEELKQQLEEKDKELNDWKDGTTICKLGELEKKCERLNNERYEESLRLQQFYSRLGVEAFGEDIQEQALRELESIKSQLHTQPKEIMEKIKNFCEDNKYQFHKEYNLYSIFWNTKSETSKSLKDFLDEILKEYEEK